MDAGIDDDPSLADDDFVNVGGRWAVRNERESRRVVSEWWARRER